jgi:hypothetical protein
MPTRIIIIGIGIITFGVMLVYLNWETALGKQQLDLELTKNEVLSEIHEAKEYVNKTANWMGTEEDTEIGYFHPPEEDEHRGDTKQNVLKYFIVGLLEDDLDIFLSSFYPESISKDLYQSTEPDKEKVARQIMARISRNGQIADIHYDISKGSFNSNANEIDILITYEDEKKAGIILDITGLADAHHPEEKIYVIQSSAWDIINDIEKSTR